MHGAVVPLLTEVQWQHQSSNATIGEISKGTASFALAATFMSTGIVEVLFSPIAGLVADRWGLDIVLLFGLLCSTFKCLLYGLTPLTPLILLTNRCLQGVVSACTQTMAMARIRDIYDEASLECTIVTGVAMCKLSFSLFAALFVGELFRYLNNRVFLLFLSIELILIVGVLLTFRTENFHKKEGTRSDHGADDAASVCGVVGYHEAWLACRAVHTAEGQAKAEENVLGLNPAIKPFAYTSVPFQHRKAHGKTRGG